MQQSGPVWGEKDVPATHVVSLRREVPWDQFQQLLSSSYIALLESLKEKGLHPTGKIITLTHKVSDNSHDVEICLPVPSAVTGLMAPVQSHQLAGGRVLSATFYGGYAAVFDSYAALPALVKERGRTLAAPARTIYLVSPADTLDETKWQTEVQAMLA